MAAPRPKKKPPVKKAPVKKKPSFLRKDTPRPARDVKPGDLRSQASQGPKKTGVKSPAETRKSISRKQTGTSRPARDLNKGGLRAQYLKNASESAASRTLGTVLRTGLRVAGPVGALVSMTVPAGEGSTKDKYSTLKKKYFSAIGPTKPKASESSSSAQIGLNKPPRWREDASWKYNAPIGPKKPKSSAILPKSSMSGGGVNNPSGQSSGDALRRRGAGTHTASYDVKAKKSGPSNTAATAAAASSGGGSKGGGSSAAVVKKGRSRPQTRTQRNETAMEQRRSSGKPKKSILSLFRKG